MFAPVLEDYLEEAGTARLAGLQVVQASQLAREEGMHGVDFTGHAPPQVARQVHDVQHPSAITGAAHCTLLPPLVHNSQTVLVATPCARHHCTALQHTLELEECGGQQTLGAT